MADITRDMTIGEILRTNPNVAPDSYGSRHALLRLSLRTGRKP